MDAAPRRFANKLKELGDEHESLEVVDVSWNWQPVAWPNDG